MPKSSLYLLGLLLVVFVTLAPPALAHAHGSRTLTLVSGNGTAPGARPLHEVLARPRDDLGGGIHRPEVRRSSPWDAAACALWADPIAGTEWIAVSPDKSGPATSLYRREFKFSPRCRDATLEIDVHADNDVTLSLNGVVFGAQPAGALLPNFQGPPEHFTTDGPFHRRWNKIGFRVRDYGNPTALEAAAATRRCQPLRRLIRGS